MVTPAQIYLGIKLASAGVKLIRKYKSKHSNKGKSKRKRNKVIYGTNSYGSSK